MTKHPCKGQCNQERYIVNKKYGLCQVCNKERLEQRKSLNGYRIPKQGESLVKQALDIKRAKNKKKSKKKPEKLSTLTKKLDKVFSQFIRLRDTDENGNGYCVTCNQKTTYKESNAGHFRRRGRMATRWNEYNVNIQDVACNKYKDGAEYEHSIYIDDKYMFISVVGKGCVDPNSSASKELFKESKRDFKPGKPYLREQIEIYKEKVKELLKDKNFDI